MGRTAARWLGLVCLVMSACSVDADASLLGPRPDDSKLPVELSGTGGAAGKPATAGNGGTSAQPPAAGRPSATGGSGGLPSAGRAGTGSAGRGAAGMSAAGAPAAGSGGACRMNLACKLAAPPSTGDAKQDCVERINQFRTECACLPPLARWTEAESCADMMAASDAMTGKAHGGFTSKLCTPGGYGQNECPAYRSEMQVVSSCLQQMWSEGPPPQMPCEGSCFQTYGHFLNMTNKQFKKVACGFAKTSSGTLWAVQNFSP